MHEAHDTMDAGLSLEIWRRLARGASLDGLSLGTVDGRTDLRGLTLARPGTQSPPSVAGAVSVAYLSHTWEARGVTIERVDLSGACIPSLRWFDCDLVDCRFDGGVFEDWRQWGTRVVRSSFRAAKLRGAGMAGVSIERQRRSSFEAVDFTGADLRETGHRSASFRSCLFARAKLRKVDFQGSVFVDCRFEGRLEDVMFYRHAFRGEADPPNEMAGVDFRHASFRCCSFRGLDLETVAWPEDDEHIVLHDYVHTLDALLGLLAKREDACSEGLRTLLELDRKWSGPRQRTGILSKFDLNEFGGSGGAATLVALLGTLRGGEGR